MSTSRAVAALLNARRLEVVPADRATALLRLARAQEKFAAAEKIALFDIDIAYVTAYDAMRIAITAHMLASGYRVRAVNGAHEAVGLYAEATIQAPSISEFQRIRRRRNKAEYDDIVIGRADLIADLDHAKRSWTRSDS